jgi:hypothetical protein
MELQHLKEKTLSAINFLESEKLASQKASSLFDSELPKTSPAPKASQNLQGEFDQEVEKYKSNPRLYELLQKYKEVFGPASLHLRHVHWSKWTCRSNLNGKAKLCAKMLGNVQRGPRRNRNAGEELIQAGLAEAYPLGSTPDAAAQFSLLKKDCKTRRMVIQFKKLNNRVKPHAGFLPNMEQMVESLAATRFKSKMDMRSGFWQVSLSDRAKDLCSFCLPSGRILRPLCMPFGLQGAPGTFQELMEILTGKAKQDPKVREILKNEGHLASFFDDTGLGTQTLEDHFYLLEKYFEVCRDNHVRIKLSKCEFLQEKMEYLGFELGWAWLEALQQKIAPPVECICKIGEGSPTIFGKFELLPASSEKLHLFQCPPD